MNIERDLTDHDWLGDDEGHNCLTCQERGDSLHLCWPQAHRCFYCEKVPCAWPDTACEPCRAHIAAMCDTVTDPVESVLSEHWSSFLANVDRTMCRCGEMFEGGPAFHRRHVAEKVYEALNLEGPSPWILGAESPTRERPEFNEATS